MTFRNIPPVDDAARNDETEPDDIVGGVEGSASEPTGLSVGDIDPEKQHNWWVENFKNIAALVIVVVSLIAVCVLAYVRSKAGDSEGLATAMGVFSTVATTALGFLFGRNSKSHFRVCFAPCRMGGEASSFPFLWWSGGSFNALLVWTAGKAFFLVLS